MKKVFTFLALLLPMLFLGWSSASAQQYYQINGFGETPLTEITPGQEVVLQAGSSTSKVSVLCGTGKSALVTENCVYTFEDAGDMDGFKTYYLKQVSTGQYIKNPGLIVGGAFDLVYTPLKSRALRLYVKQASNFIQHSQYQDQKDKITDWTTICVYPDNAAETIAHGSFIMTNVEKAKGKEIQYIDCNRPNGNPFYGGYVDTNWWFVYSVTKMTGVNYLSTVFQQLFPGGTADLYAVGDAPGQISSDLNDELQKTFTEAQNLLSSSNPSDQACSDMVDKLRAIVKKCKAGVHPMVTGYYYISCPERGDKSYVTTNGTDALWSPEWMMPEDKLSLDDAKYVWKIAAVPNDTTFTLQNYFTQKFIGQVDGYSQTLPMVEQTGSPYVFALHASKKGAFAIVRPDKKDRAMHEQTRGHAIVYWYPDAAPSGFVLTPIPEEKVMGLEQELKQARLNDKLSNLNNMANALYSQGFVYKNDKATPDSKYADPGLISKTDSMKVFSMNPETTEGPAYNLIDDSLQTFFHSRWSAASPEYVKYPNICADLGKAVGSVTIKYTKRLSWDASPINVHFYATNDTTGFYNGTAKWMDEGMSTLSYPYDATVGSTTKKNITGVQGCVFADGQKYRYIRIDVTSTSSNKKLHGILFFNLSELHFYEGATLDKEKSLIEGVPANIRKDLEDAMKEAKAEIAAGAATEATYDKLDKAYKAFQENYPDPSILKSMLAEASKQAAKAVEGTDLGYFQTGAKEEYQKAIDDINSQIKDVMSMEEINMLKDKLKAANDKFLSQLIKPADDAVYFIQCATTSSESGTAKDAYLYADGNGKSNVHWGGLDKNGVKDPNLSTRLNFFWKAIKNSDGSYSFRNMATGTYMGNQKKDSRGLTMRLKNDSTNMILRSAKVAGLFNLVQAENLFANAQPGSHNIVTWHAADSTDNSAFKFIPAQWDGTYHYDIDSIETKTLPYAIMGTVTGAGFYKVVGKKDGNLVLSRYGDDDIIPAATPFVIMREAGTGTKVVDFILDGVETLDQIKYSFDPQTQNGMVGVLADDSIGAGKGYLLNGKIVETQKGNWAAANSAYFVKENIPNTTESGDATIDMSDYVTTGINNLVADPKALRHDLYDLSGRRVKAPNKGLYILNGKKVLIK